jgi:hypothetical protein
VSGIRYSVKLVIFAAFVEALLVYMYFGIREAGPPGFVSTILWSAIIWFIAVALVIFRLVKSGN